MADTTIDLLKNSSYVEKMDELIAAVKLGSGATSDVEWDNVLDKPTTIAGYGITDAKIENGTITLGNQTITPLTSAPVTSVNSKIGAVTLSATDVSAIPSTLTGTAGQVLTKTADGQEWKDVDIPTALPNPNALTFTGAVEGSYDGSKPLTVDIPSGGGSGGSNIIFDSGEISEEVNMIGPIDISAYSKIRIFGKAYPSANSAGRRAAQLYFGNNAHRLLCRAGVNKLFDTSGNPQSFLIYLDVGANSLSAFSFSGFNAGNIFDDSDYCVSSEVTGSDGGCLIYSTSFDLANMYITAQDDLSTRPWGVGTRIMVIGDA